MCVFEGHPGRGEHGPGTGFLVEGIRQRFFLRASSTYTPAGVETPELSVLATIDTGAEISMIRRDIAEQLKLKPLGLLEVAHFEGSAMVMTYLAEFGCDTCSERRTVRLADDGGTDHGIGLEFPEMCIGKDILQYFKLQVDFTIGTWTLDVDHGLWPDDVEFAFRLPD